MRHSTFAKEVIGPDDVTFSHVWLVGGFLLFGIVAVAYNAWGLRRAEKRSFKQTFALAWAATIYLGLTLFGFVWALPHAMENS
ncbi:hypothetical protein OG864_01835 [Streptomyces sp. NBC_00124]|uniref:hypothetical protein n=1 Tax=Streptomyces sp. NBC_00124 TaxID=2975662 RepID=UPI0022580F75|nr:hypothetical protein [Streptomyces sp. NBC_00124]MCX5357501.1 hypothetical protein [Streptomyces sp. NBC_00124]